MRYKLGELANLITEKISILELNLDNYISTESMLPNKEGKESASKLPSSKNVNMHIKGDILVSNIRPYFKKIWLATENGGHSADVLCFRVKDINLISNGFLFFSLFKDDFFDFMMLGSKGTKMPRGDKEAIMQYEINVPNILEQQEIVSVLSSIMSKMDVLKKINDNLLELALINFNKIEEKSSNSFKLNELASIRSAKRIFAKDYQTNGVPFYRGKEISKLALRENFDSELFISTSKFNDLKTKTTTIPKYNDILVTSVGTIGNIYLVSKNDLPFYYKDGNVTCITDIDTSLVSPEYLYIFLKSKNGKKEIDKATIGSTQKALTINAIGQFDIPIIKTDEMNNLTKMLSVILKSIDSNTQEIRVLMKLRDTLISELI